MTTASRVLVLDDEPGVARTPARLVESAGHEARFSSEPEEFLALQRSWDPTHVILDLNMPQMDGLEVVDRLALDGCRAGVILSSGVSPRILDAAARVATDHGLRIAGVLPKPFAMSSLEPLLAEAPDDGSLPGGRGGFTAPVSVDDLRAALGPGGTGLSVAFQPKTSLRTGETVGFEALARWTHPVLGPVPPPVFVELAETHDLVDALTDRVLELSLGWLATCGCDVKMSVNVSALSLSDPHFADRIRATCRRLGVAPSSVILELTETGTSQDPALALRNLTQLRIHGFALSLDDFGTGYSSLSQLQNLPFSEIKIDRSFVATALDSEESRTLVRTVIDLGLRLDLVSVAEGVEDQATLDLVRDLGCDLVQGYFVSRPLDPEAATRWLADHRPAAVAG